MNQVDSKTKLLEATLKVVRAKGYGAARVEDVCAEAGVTKGSFFHHFKSKDELGVAAAKLWGERADALFAAGDYHRHDDPRDRLLAYVDFRRRLLSDDFTDFTCFAGDIVQEAYVTHPEVSRAAAATILSHAASLEADIAAAMASYGVGGFTAQSLARHTQVVVQGAFILAKATGEVDAAAESLDHLRRYFERLFAKRER